MSLLQEFHVLRSRPMSRRLKVVARLLGRQPGPRKQSKVK